LDVPRLDYIYAGRPIEREVPRTRVKTERSFTAEDPWNQNRPTVFTIEAYLMAAKGTMPRRRPSKRTLFPYFLGIRSEMDGVEHMLPESLAYLWRPPAGPHYRARIASGAGRR